MESINLLTLGGTAKNTCNKTARLSRWIALYCIANTTLGLTFDGRVRPGRLLPPLGDEDGDGVVAAHLEPPHADPDAQAREHLLVAVTHRHVAPVDHDRQQRVHLGRVFGGGHHCN